jgi:hypothetical protein
VQRDDWNAELEFLSLRGECARPCGERVAAACPHYRGHGERLPLFVSAATKPEIFQIVRSDADLPKPSALDTSWI